ncbi:MAG: PAS domain S-box protein [Eubacteriales bacterium]
MGNFNGIILIVDDNQDRLISMTAQIQKSFPDFAVRTALTWQQCFRITSEEEIGVIFADIGMQGIDTACVCRKLKTEIRTRDIPVVFITAAEDKDLRILALESGADGFLSKPVDDSELTAQIRTMLNVKRMYTNPRALLDVLNKENDTHKKREESLLEAQRLAHIGSFEHDMYSNRITWTKEGLRIYGVENAQDLDTPDKVHQYIHPEDRDYELQCIEKAMLNKNEAEFNFRISRKDGEVRTLNMRFTPIFDAAGKNIRCIGAIQDVTQKEQLAKELTYNHNLVQSLLDNTTDAIYIKDTFGRYLLFNASAEKTVGKTAQEVLGKDDTNLFPMDEAMTVMTTDREIMKSKKTSTNVEYVTNALGEHVVFSSTKGPILDENHAVIGLFGIARDITELEKREIALRESESRLVAAQKIAHVGNWELSSTTKSIWASEEAFNIYGIEYSSSFLPLAEVQKCVLPQYRKLLDDKLIGLIARNDRYNIEFKIRKANTGEERFIYSNAVLQLDSTGKDYKVLGTIQDITESKEIEIALEESKKYLESLINHTNALIIVWDENFEITRINSALEELIGRTAEEVLGKRLDLLFPANQADTSMELFKNTDQVNKEDALEVEIIHKNGSVRTVLWNLATIYNQDDKTHFSSIAQGQDITERIEAERNLLYQSYHDYLTGLNNRRFYEEELKTIDNEKNLPLSIIMGDVNGIKLVNDSFGQTIGDQLLIRIAAVLTNGCRAGDIISRIGGDEFVIILPRTDAMETEKVISRIKELAAAEMVESLQLSISFGYETKTAIDQNIQGIIKIAEDHMYRHKLFDSSSMRSTMIDLIMNTLYEKNNREMLHSKRVSEICEAIADKLNLDKDDINQIRIAGLLHDIGKIGIDENILNSTQKLSDQEWTEIKKHSEIGYRILCSAVEFSGIALFVLDHHERWDGKGYPKGLKGEEISFPARIIALADSYDAMTAERTYRPVLGKNHAVEEIRRCAGTQYDPEIARVFVEKVLGEVW